VQRLRSHPIGAKRSRDAAVDRGRSRVDRRSMAADRDRSRPTISGRDLARGGRHRRLAAATAGSFSPEARAEGGARRGACASVSQRF
jgi:hypothetical protein